MLTLLSIIYITSNTVTFHEVKEEYQLQGGCTEDPSQLMNMSRLCVEENSWDGSWYGFYVADSVGEAKTKGLFQNSPGDKSSLWENVESVNSSVVNAIVICNDSLPSVSYSFQRIYNVDAGGEFMNKLYSECKGEVQFYSGRMIPFGGKWGRSFSMATVLTDSRLTIGLGNTVSLSFFASNIAFNRIYSNDPDEAFPTHGAMVARFNIFKGKNVVLRDQTTGGVSTFKIANVAFKNLAFSTTLVSCNVTDDAHCSELPGECGTGIGEWCSAPAGSILLGSYTTDTSYIYCSAVKILQLTPNEGKELCRVSDPEVVILLDYLGGDFISKDKNGPIALNIDDSSFSGDQYNISNILKETFQKMSPTRGKKILNNIAFYSSDPSQGSYYITTVFENIVEVIPNRWVTVANELGGNGYIINLIETCPVSLIFDGLKTIPSYILEDYINQNYGYSFDHSYGDSSDSIWTYIDRNSTLAIGDYLIRKMNEGC